MRRLEMRSKTEEAEGQTRSELGTGRVIGRVVSIEEAKGRTRSDLVTGRATLTGRTEGRTLFARVTG